MGLRSFFILGFQFFLHILRRLFFLHRPGRAEQFLENYRADDLFSFEAGDRELLPLWQRCTGCGLCEAACPVMTGPSFNQGRLSFAALASSTWRDTSANRWALDHANVLRSCSNCDQCEQACPEGIPLRSLADFVARMAAG